MLSDKHQRFVAEYLVDLNATAAARRAGYSEASAKTTGPRLRQRRGIAAAITAGLSDLTREIDVTSERIVEELAGVAFRPARGADAINAKVRALLALLRYEEAKAPESGGGPAEAATARERLAARLEVVRENLGQGDGNLPSEDPGEDLPIGDRAIAELPIEAAIREAAAPVVVAIRDSTGTPPSWLWVAVDRVVEVVRSRGARDDAAAAVAAARALKAQADQSGSSVGEDVAEAASELAEAVLLVAIGERGELLREDAAAKPEARYRPPLPVAGPREGR